MNMAKDDGKGKIKKEIRNSKNLCREINFNETKKVNERKINLYKSGRFFI